MRYMLKRAHVQYEGEVEDRFVQPTSLFDGAFA